MQNLFVLNGQYRFAYWLTWTFIGTIYWIILAYFFRISWLGAVLDALAFGSLFALMGIAVWYIVKFSRLDTNSVFNTLATHIVAAGVLVFTIITIVESMLSLTLPGSNAFYDFNSDLHIYRLLAGGLIYAFLAINFYLVFYYEEFRSRKLREVELDQGLKSAELNMLKAQINPHFVFNSLNSVSSLTLTDPEKAHDMVIQLAEFLRYSIRKNAVQLVDLEQEMDAIQLYLAIEKIRFGDRLKIEINCQDNLKIMKLPALILQPIIENAIKYSLHETDFDSKIIINCSRFKEALTLVVKNNFDKEGVTPKGEGIGLSNVRSRCNLVYGRNDLLDTSEEDDIFIAKLTIPQL
jgi:two-component system LytT family sensor kinase